METQEQLDQLEELILDGTRIPFSGARIVDEQEALIVLEELSLSIPKEISLAQEIISNKEKYIVKAKEESRAIVREAKELRNRMLNKEEIKQEARRQITLLQLNTQEKCKEILNKAKNKADLLEKQSIEAYSDAKQLTKQKYLRLNEDYNKKIELLENSIEEKYKLETENFNRLKLNYEKELNSLKLAKVEMSKSLLQEEESSKQRAQEIIKKTQSYCLSLINEAKLEEQKISNEANKYVTRTIVELENTINNIYQQLSKGKNELIKTYSGNENNISKKKPVKKSTKNKIKSLLKRFS